jgi:hypothetical protein
VNNLSPKAYAFLVAIKQHNLNISAETIMDRFSVGRRAALSGLKELRDHALISTTKQRIGNRIMTVSYVTQKGEAMLFGAVTSHFVESHNVTPDSSNEQISRITNSTVISKKHISAEPKEKTRTINIEVNAMSWGGIFETTSDSGDELRNEIAKDRERKKAEAKEAKKKSKAEKDAVRKSLQGDRKTYRERTPVDEWRVVDVCFEFADRIEKHFHIAPWEVTQSKFSGALGGARDRLNTNGAVEVAAMDLFFNQINIREYKDAEVLWRLFVSRLPALIGMVKMTSQTEQTDEVARKAREKARRELREDV